MKQLLMLAVIMCAAAMVQAQHVNPLDSLVTQLPTDSMYAKFASNPAGMVAVLQMAQTKLEMDEKMLKSAQKQLKDEQAFAKSLETYLKNSISSLNDIKKSFDNNRDGLEKMQSTINGQINALHKVNLKDQAYKDNMEQKLNGYLTSIHDAIDRANAASRNIDDQLVDATRQQTDLANFNEEIVTKQDQLNKLNQTHKTNKETVKTELKAWKSLVPKK